MGVTVHYRGSIPDLERIEDFEDRVLDLVLELGGEARIWRSACETDPTRMVRGLIIDLAPGQEPTCFLFSPEGWLIRLFEIEEAEDGKLTEQPYCWVKTQFGPIEGHVALVELLRAIKAEFIPNLEVMDEGDYWETRDFENLRRKFTFLKGAIDTFAEELEKHPLTSEAAEDENILLSRIERIAQLVHQKLSRPSEHPPVEFPEDELGIRPDPVENETRWDALFRENRRKQERMTRSIEESMLQGAEIEDAFEEALDEVVPPPIESDDEPERPWLDEPIEEESDEPWKASLEGDAEFEDRDDEDEIDSWRREKHPLQKNAVDLMVRLAKLEKPGDRTTNLDAACRSMGDVVGGLAQALPLPPEYEIDDVESGLCIVQLKRAARGTAFAQGSLFLVRADKQIDKETFDELYEELVALQAAILEELREVRRMSQ